MPDTPPIYKRALEVWGEGGRVFRRKGRRQDPHGGKTERGERSGREGKGRGKSKLTPLGRHRRACGPAAASRPGRGPWRGSLVARRPIPGSRDRWAPSGSRTGGVFSRRPWLVGGLLFIYYFLGGWGDLFVRSSSSLGTKIRPGPCSQSIGVYSWSRTLSSRLGKFGSRLHFACTSLGFYLVAHY